jgi:hypothetical protein
MNRRGFLGSMLTALGAAAVANPLTDLLATEVRATLPEAAHFVLPPATSFFVERVTFRNCGAELITSPELLIGSWKIATGLALPPDEYFNLEFAPSGGYQLDPDEKVSVIGPKNSMVMLWGVEFPHQRPEKGWELVPKAYWLRV